MSTLGQNEVYKSSLLIEKEADTTYGHQIIAWDFSKIGQYQKALISWDKDFHTVYSISEEDSLNFLKYSPFNAIEYILSKADEYQVIMINEAHHISLHRNFTKRLLKGLSEKGFKYFGLEAINQKDNINERKFPVQSSGSYTNEPEFGNLLRQALELDYLIFGYEATFGANGKQREIEQAENIKKILDKDPNAKILIHAGFGHIREDENISNWEKAMAGRFREFTGIDPLTIDQVSMTERSSEEYENPFLKLADVKESTVFVTNDHSGFIDKNLKKQFDLSVFHPKTKYRETRPNWLFEEDKQFYPISLSNNEFSYPILIFAYIEKEYKEQEPQELIPTDIIEIENNLEKTGLVLDKGNYFLIFKDSAGKIKIERIEVK
jgi:hypothetical protein